jgi:hypothetical protein
VKKIYNLIRPGEDPSYELASQLVERMFFNEKRYNLGEVGRYKLNSRLKLEVPVETYVLTREDVVAIVKTLIRISATRKRWTTSTTSPTAVSAPWASCWKRNIPTACCAWRALPSSV